MAEAVGLVLGVLGLAGLVTTCTDCLELVQLGRAYATDYELLQTKFETQKLRFLIWTQVSGFAQDPGYDTRLDSPGVRPVVTRILNNLYRLLSDEQQLSKRYGLRIDNGTQQVSSKIIFRESYQRFHARLHRTQRQTSTGAKAKWAISDKQKFSNLVQNLKDLVDSLDEISRSLQLLHRTDDLMAAEVESITDPGSLRLLEEALTDNERLSDSASRQLRALQSITSGPSTRNTGGGATMSSDAGSFCTAPSNQVQGDGDDQIITSHTESILDTGLTQNQRLAQDFRQLALRSGRTGSENANMHSGGPIDISSVGKALHQLRKIDIQHARAVIQRIQANATPQELRIAMILERYLDSRPTKFVSLTPVGDNLLQLLGRIEGPPGSPYQGGIFHVQISISDDFPFSPPTCRCLTKVFHPNIDHSGKICLEVLELRNWRMELINLEIILLSISALLDQPNVDDPLVPEVAATFIQDRQKFNEIAKDWTARFASEQVATNLSVSACAEDVSDWRTGFLEDRLRVVQSRTMLLIKALERCCSSEAGSSTSASLPTDSMVSSYISLLYQLSLQLNNLDTGSDKSSTFEGFDKFEYEMIESFFDACILHFVALAKDKDWRLRFPFLKDMMKNDVTRGTGNPDLHDFINPDTWEESKKVLKELGHSSTVAREERAVDRSGYDKLFHGMQKLIRHAIWLNGDAALVRVERSAPSGPSGPPLLALEGSQAFPTLFPGEKLRTLHNEEGDRGAQDREQINSSKDRGLPESDFELFGD